jgi:hypothetical protein
MPTRRAAGALLAMLLASSCGGPHASKMAAAPVGYRTYGDPAVVSDGAQPSPVAGGRVLQAEPRRLPAPRGGGRIVMRGTPRKVAVPVLDKSEVGQNATLYLRSSVPKLVVEIGAVAGKEPTQQALDFLKATLSSVLDKPGGIEVRLTETWAAQGAEYSLEDVDRLERDHRQTHSTPGAASLYLMFLNGRLRGYSALGMAYRASTIIILTDEVQSASTGSASRIGFEKSTILHEVGHQLGLVNLAYRSPRDHEDRLNDPAKRGHSKNPQSVMYYAVEMLNVNTILRGGPPTAFDSDDLADLADVRSGALGGP